MPARASEASRIVREISLDRLRTLVTIVDHVPLPKLRAFCTRPANCQPAYRRLEARAEPRCCRARALGVVQRPLVKLWYTARAACWTMQSRHWKMFSDKCRA